jgi:argininosuccinate synthase
MKNLSTGLLTTLLAWTIMSPPVVGQHTGGDAEAGTGADAVDTGSTGGANDESRFDPGWIGLAGLLGLAGLMGRNRDHRHDMVTGTTTHP